MYHYSLFFDVGNTNMKVGLAGPDPEAPLAATFVLPTNPSETSDSLGLAVLACCRQAGAGPEAIERCTVCSVVPAMDYMVRTACRRYFGCEPRFAAQDLPVPLENRYERPQEVGADRLVTAYAGQALYPGDAHIVIDFGTATTFDCVRDGAYLGGLIAPGVLSSTRALATQAAKLPQIRLELDPTAGGEPVIGRSTEQSLSHGIIFGFGAMVDGLVERLARKVAGPDQGAVTVVATGGLAELVDQVATSLDHLREHLLFEGLRRLTNG
jgi:type III pantothenate kinase